jgi:RNA polymerase sigma-70 factor (ECF subfamily)
MATDPTRRQADERLLRSFVADEVSACRQLEGWARQILAYRRLGLSREDVDDIVQEVLAAVWQAATRPQFALQVGLHAFVRKVTLARAIDRVRRNRVRRAEPLSEHADTRPSVGARLEFDAESSALFAALARLEERCREVIRLHYFEDWPYARIAALEGRSESTLRVRMFHCLRALRGMLSAGGVGRS